MSNQHGQIRHLNGSVGSRAEPAGIGRLSPLEFPDILITSRTFSLPNKNPAFSKSWVEKISTRK